ncbi:MAG: ureidoglycolate dehydrogenase [Aerococcaceae bacterium]|nr:ureidoglycolate dehydrogenase [Aerococcaceae bacterium]
MEEKLINVTPEKLFDLVTTKLTRAGLPKEHADEVARHLVYADMCGIHSHGVVRVEYYAERISKGGVNLNPTFSYEKTGPSTAIFHGDNAQGHYVANYCLDQVIDLAKESGVAVVGVSKVSHTGMLSYYVDKIARHDLIGIAMCQSDPMVVPYGGAENYYGTNPIAFSAPRTDGEPIVFDMATTVQAWGKILDARSKSQQIPDTWAVDEHGHGTTDPFKVSGLLPISGPKGYGLMMMVDILSGVLLGLPFGKHVSSMYSDLSAGRDLGHIYIVIDPSRFTDLNKFKDNITQTVNELHAIKPAKGFDQVYYPGENNFVKYLESEREGINIPEGIYNYLVSKVIHEDRYGGKSAFAK